MSLMGLNQSSNQSIKEDMNEGDIDRLGGEKVTVGSFLTERIFHTLSLHTALYPILPLLSIQLCHSRAI